MRDYVEYGVLCDRRYRGHGMALLAISERPENAEDRALELCDITREHPHLLVQRRHVFTDWSDPISGQNASAPLPASAPEPGDNA